MQKLLPLFLLLFFLEPVISKAQHIGPMRIQYSDPGVTNDLELRAQISIPSQPAYRINHQSRISNDTLYVTACYYAGIQGAPTTFNDTISLGAISLNLTTIHFKISYSMSPQCSSIINSTTKIQTFAISSPTGICNNYSKSEILIYPNPAQDLLFVKNQSFQSIILRDLTGKMLQSKNFRPAADLQLDLRTLNKGVYLAELISENGKSRFKRILKE